MHRLCTRYPAYTPETAREAPSWVIRNLQILTEAGEFEPDHGQRS